MVTRSFTFEPTPAVAASRKRQVYRPCPVCGNERPVYLFHRTGVRYVQCSACRLVFVNPTGEAGENYFDIVRVGQHAAPSDEAHLLADFEAFLGTVSTVWNEQGRSPIKRTLLLGRSHPRFVDGEHARAMGLALVPVNDEEFARLAVDADVGFAEAALAKAPDVVVLHELLEACADPAAVIARIVDKLPEDSWVVVTYADAHSIPARLLRRNWPQFFRYKRSYFTTSNVAALMSRAGYTLVRQFPLPTKYTASYLLERVAGEGSLAKAARTTPLGGLSMPVRTGQRAALFRRGDAVTDEKLSIVLPVYNEARYVAQVIETILGKELGIPKELVIVESNSTDGTRDIVKSFEGRPGVKLVFEERPRGKGHAVRTGLASVTGSIILIQDADFEYDVDDYDALLEPILQRRTAFVLGSRSLGLDDWKVRRFEEGRLKALAMNVAQVMFAKTFNVLYQQHTTDVNTMFKVFRRECLDGLDLRSNGFELDIELVCKLVKNGNAPIEVPVNYVSRGFEEGKKISFVRDAIPSYASIFWWRV